MIKHFLLINKNNPNDVVISNYRILNNEYTNLPLTKIVSERIFFKDDEKIKNMLSKNYKTYFRKEGIKIRNFINNEPVINESIKTNKSMINKKINKEKVINLDDLRKIKLLDK